MITGYSTDLPDDILLDTGVLFVGSTPVGASRGGLSFEPGRETTNVEFDGKRSDIKGLDRVSRWNSMISGTFIEFDETDIARLEPGSTSAAVGGVTTITPKVAGTLFASGDYLTNVRLVYQRGNGAYAAVLFASAFAKKWGPMRGQDKGEAEIPVELHARLVVAANGDVPKCPYVVELRDALP